jgi:hypothetical protein
MALTRFFMGVLALVVLTAQSAAGSSLRRTETEENMSIPRRLEAQEFMQAISAPTGPFCYPELGFDFTDFDIGNTLAQAGECCSKCNAFPGCKAYSWSNFNGGTCWFKSQRGAVVYKAGVQSALLFLTAQQTCKLEVGIDYVDNDLARVDSPNAGGCCDKCKAYPGCRAFSFTTFLGGSCWLKSAKGMTVANKDVQSAEVYPSPVDTNCPGLKFGFDLFDNDIGNKFSAKPEGCCDICKAQNGCRAFAWTNLNGGTCWLKSRTGTSVANPNVVSATVLADPVCDVKNGVDYFDNDIGNKPSPTAEGCCAICKDRSDCHAFSWTTFNGGTCWLKSAKGMEVPNANVWSAVVV